jgi:hypothetical protein
MGIYVASTSKYIRWGQDSIFAVNDGPSVVYTTDRPSCVKRRPQTSRWSRPLDLSDVECERRTVRRITTDRPSCRLASRAVLDMLLPL